VADAVDDAALALVDRPHAHASAAAAMAQTSREQARARPELILATIVGYNEAPSRASTSCRVSLCFC
jgi:hypothetical protein